MKQALIILSVSIMLMTACSSNNTPKTQYYLLNSPTLKNSVVVNNLNNPRVAITLLELPDYLKQPSLVLQLSDHQLHYSHFHMWADPLQSSIIESLTQDLNTKNNPHNYNVTLSSSVESEVIIKITGFHSTHQSQVILAGNYWLHGKNKRASEKIHHFNLAIALDTDGYPHAVAQMRNLITQLAHEINKSLTNLNSD